MWPILLYLIFYCLGIISRNSEDSDIKRLYRLSLTLCGSRPEQPSYWCSSPRMALVEKEEEEEAEKAMKGKFMEEEPAGLVSGIKIKHLAKASPPPTPPLPPPVMNEQSDAGRRPRRVKVCVCMCVLPIGIQSGQQDAAGRAESHYEHVRGTDHRAARTQRGREDHHAVHADR